MRVSTRPPYVAFVIKSAFCQFDHCNKSSVNERVPALYMLISVLVDDTK